MAVAAIIAERRQALGLSMAACSTKAVVSRSTWHDIEHGKRKAVHPRTLERFEEVLGLEPGTLHAAWYGVATPLPVQRWSITFESHPADDEGTALARRHLAQIAGETADPEEVWRLLAYFRRLRHNPDLPDYDDRVLDLFNRLLAGDPNRTRAAAAG